MSDIDLHDPDKLIEEIKRIFWGSASHPRGEKLDQSSLDEEHKPDREILAVFGAILDTFDPERTALEPETPAPQVENADDGFRVHVLDALVNPTQARAIAFDLLRKARACDDANYDARDQRASPRQPVTCVLCGYKGFAIFVPDDRLPTQGDDVASSIYTYEGQWFIQGHYGSSHFDCDRYQYIRNFPETRADPVCDGCIQKIVDSGDVEQVPGNFP